MPARRPNDKAAAHTARRVVNEFWEEFEAALAPGRASKQCYLEQLEELVCDAEARIECVEAELEEESK